MYSILDLLRCSEVLLFKCGEENMDPSMFGARFLVAAFLISGVIMLMSAFIEIFFPKELKELESGKEKEYLIVTIFIIRTMKNFVVTLQFVVWIILGSMSFFNYFYSPF